jgi:aquaporin Z
MKKILAELIGTYLLVFLGTSAVVSTLSVTGGTLVVPCIVEIAFTFGLALVAIAYAFGPISGAHVNPMVTLGMVVAKKMEPGDALRYWVAQFGGGVLAALTLQAAYGDMAERFNFGANAPGQKFGVQGALIFEIISSTLFFLVIYGVAASKRAVAGFAGLPIGLYLAASHLAGIPISGSSLNPARDFGPALLAGGDTLGRVWIYFVGPLAGGVLGGFFATHLHEGKED